MSAHSRRRFLAGAAALTSGIFIGPLLASENGAVTRISSTAGGPLPSGVFSLGVASGEPSADGVVLWTRLAPRPLEGGGMPPRAVPVRWQIADDPQFRRIVATGEELALPTWGHSVHIEAAGLRPNRPYYYRFHTHGQTSPIGRTHTAPIPGRESTKLKFAVASCQNWQDGYFTAHEHLAAEQDLNFIAFLGDAIYETKPRTKAVRRHEGVAEPTTLMEYRNRYAQYRTDPQLQRAHACAPWIMSFDDHEVDNNWAGSDHTNTARRAAALQAYYEHMPLRVSAQPFDAYMRMHRRFVFGDLVSLHMLDTRQYRTRQPRNLRQALDPQASILGAQQERWLREGMSGSPARWNLIGNQVMWAACTDSPSCGTDNWDGYRVQRARILASFRQVRNPVVLTGDRHATWVSELRPHFDRPESTPTAIELTTTSISSGGEPRVERFQRQYAPLFTDNPHWRYVDNRRGYLLCEASKQYLRTSLRVVNSVTRQTGSVVNTAAEFIAECDRPGITEISTEEGRRT
ncbi:MAG: alkaline phosphatase [Corynebacteriales bacterium]|nr:alkaline phosphatase [Mycobacteriales bacterium]